MSTTLPVPYPSLGLIRSKTAKGWHRDLWIPGSIDYKVFDDIFWGDALDTKYPAAKTNGTSAAVTFTEHNAQGYLELVSGTDDDGYAGQGMGLQVTGDQGALAEFIFQTPSAITTLKFEVGLSDADDDAGAVNVKATPTVTASDCAVLCFDTDDDTNVTFVTVKAAGTAQAVDVPNFTLEASTTYVAALRVDGDNVEAWLGKAGSDLVKVAQGGGAAIEGGTALTPWVFCQARAASSRTVRLYRWRVIWPAF